MIRKVRELVLDIFEQEALMIGGMVAVHQIDDYLVWRIIKDLDTIRLRTMRQLDAISGDAEVRRPNLEPHPAIEDFLLSLRRDTVKAKVESQE